MNIEEQIKEIVEKHWVVGFEDNEFGEFSDSEGFIEPEGMEECIKDLTNLLTQQRDEIKREAYKAGYYAGSLAFDGTIGWDRDFEQDYNDYLTQQSLDGGDR